MLNFLHLEVCTALREHNNLNPHASIHTNQWTCSEIWEPCDCAELLANVGWCSDAHQFAFMNIASQKSCSFITAHLEFSCICRALLCVHNKGYISTFLIARGDMSGRDRGVLHTNLPFFLLFWLHLFQVPMPAAPSLLWLLCNLPPCVFTEAENDWYVQGTVDGPGISAQDHSKWCFASVNVKLAVAQESWEWVQEIKGWHKMESVAERKKEKDKTENKSKMSLVIQLE